MIEIQVKYQGKKHLVNFPSGWDELTFRQLAALRKQEGNDTGHLLEILTGIERNGWLNMPSGIAGTLARLLDWVQTPLNWYQLIPPKAIKIGEKEYQVPKDLGLKTFGQKITLETKVQKMLEQKKDLFEIMPDAMAIYFQPIVDGGNFDDQKAEDMRELFYDCPAIHVFPIASFFLRTSSAYQNFGKITSNPAGKANTDHFRKKQGSGILKKLMVFFSSFIPWRRR